MEKVSSIVKSTIIRTLFIGVLITPRIALSQKADNEPLSTDYMVRGLDASKFSDLFDLSETELAKLGAMKLKATSKPGYPCVVSLEDAEIGEEILLLPYDHISSNSPFQSRGPIYVRNKVEKKTLKNSVPENLKIRTLSVRAYDEEDMMVGARTIDGTELQAYIQETFENPEAKYIQVHISSPGCFNCQVDRL